MEPFKISGPISNAIRERIIADFGMLDDIPYELANTITNICYKLYLASIERGILEVEQNKFSDDDAIWLMDAYEKLKKVIPILRDTPLGTEYDMSVNYMLAKLKYKTPNAGNKTYFRLKFDRIGKKVEEIPDLAKIVKVVTI